MKKSEEIQELKGRIAELEVEVALLRNRPVYVQPYYYPAVCTRPHYQPLQWWQQQHPYTVTYGSAGYNINTMSGINKGEPVITNTMNAQSYNVPG